MTDKELKKLSRAELLELLMIQTRESEVLHRKLDAAEQELKNRELRIREAGSLANAAMEINGVLASAQKAAKQYLDNIARMEREARFRCQQMLDEAMDEAERIREEAADSLCEPVNTVVYQFPKTKEPEQKVPAEPKPLQKMTTESEGERAGKFQTEHPAVSFLKAQQRKALGLIHRHR